MGPSLPLSRVLALVGGLALLAAFFMPWFASGGLLLSGQFLHTFLATASAADIQRFVPGTTPTEQLLLGFLVELFPACGTIATALCLAGLANLGRARPVVDAFLALTGLIALVAWAGGVTRLPPDARWEIGLWLMVVAALAIVAGAALELAAYRRRTESRNSAAG
jgi:hypothetical protein